ncbi:hypothetical protein LTR64_007121 [Lithohypha guttulata]|uniref:uncharacterized protein n=1 Tax=Lithohypha guttulata TaxID=1690604 RepID=UPI002DDF8FB3|nr:hypothetical protein LTR51_004323 [Lithohypha guttulata]
MAEGSNSAKALAKGAMHISKRIVLSYLIDWILIFVIAGIGGAFNRLQHSNHRPFSLQDPSISYPLRPDTVTVSVLLVVALLAPLIITGIVSLIFVPGPTAAKGTPKSLIWRRKLWELNTAWMGLGLSLATTFVATEGLKDLGGKPRPYAIARCNPDLSAVAQYRVGGLGTSFDNTGATPILVSSGICQERDPLVLREIFASWPSGHSSFSFAGLLYLTLFLCAKFATGLPYQTVDRNTSNENTFEYDQNLRRPTSLSAASNSSNSSITRNGNTTMPPPPRNSGAAPPVYLLLLTIFLPIGTAIFICVSRWLDFHHHGIDILSGAFIGAFSATLSFRYYHMSIRRGSGWSWGARSRGRAFWVGVGRDGYVGEEGWTTGKNDMARRKDIETGQHGMVHKHEDVLGAGVADTRTDQNMNVDERYAPGPSASGHASRGAVV